MSEPQTPQTPSPTAAPSPAPAGPGPNPMANFLKLSLAEKIVTCIAILVVLGWIITWSQAGGWKFAGLFVSWFPTLSFFGALAVAALVILRTLGIKPLAPNIEKHVIPVASLLPVVGYLMGLISNIGAFLTIGGSMALAYVSAMTYWKKHIPVIPLQDGASAPGGSAPPAPPAA